MSRNRLLASIAILAAAVIITGCETTRSSQVERASLHLAEATTFLDQGLSDSALAAFGMALEENPRLTEAHVGMAGIYRERGDYENASAAYERATETDPQNFEAHYYLGLMQQLMGKVKEAIRVYLRALAINPNDFRANRELASAYLQLNRPNEALPYAKRATKLDAESQPAWANLAATYSLMGKYEEAIDAYREAAELGELADPVLLGLADAHIRMGNYARAMNTLNSLIRRNPTATAFERLGYAQFKLRRFEDALKNFRKASSMDPNDTSSLNGVGVALMTLYIEGGSENNYQRRQALDAWRQSLQINDRQPRIADLVSRYSR